jgi:hypothetical protein
MTKKLSATGKEEIIRAVAERYAEAKRFERRLILDHFISITGYHRKHAIRLLRSGGGRDYGTRKARLRFYDEAVREALVVLWEASDRLCGKRLKPLIPVLLGSLQRHGHLLLEPNVQERVMRASAATIDRLLASTRLAIHGGRRVSAKPAVRRLVPVRTFSDWSNPSPGFLEIDLVVHCGESMAGSFVHTLVLTDISSGWTECVALPYREATAVVSTLRMLQPLLPFRILGLDSDNGSEFVNDAMVEFCSEAGIEFTRSRPYRKNDQAWVEQKNGAVVRRLVGYRRLEGPQVAQALNQLYAASRLFVNFFQPSFKLASKTRIGSRIRKQYHPPQTPCNRLLGSDTIPEPTKNSLRQALSLLDPLRLLDEVRGMQQHIADLAAGAIRASLPAANDSSLQHLLEGLSTAWRNGEVRPTHREPEKTPRAWRTRVDPFESVWPRIQGWLEAEPDRTPKEIFERLLCDAPGSFTDGQIRTLQRRVKEWRRSAIHKLVFTGPILSK